MPSTRSILGRASLRRPPRKASVAFWPLRCYSRAHLGLAQSLWANQSASDDIDAEILDLLTTAVSRAVGDFARFKSEREVAESIQRALEHRAPIEQAKGMLMAIHGINADEAFDLLRKQSQETNVRLRTVAANFVEEPAHLPPRRQAVDPQS